MPTKLEESRLGYHMVVPFFCSVMPVTGHSDWDIDAGETITGMLVGWMYCYCSCSRNLVVRTHGLSAAVRRALNPSVKALYYASFEHSPNQLFGC